MKRRKRCARGFRGPFESESPMDVMLMQIGTPAPRLCGDDIPLELVEIVARGMEKRPEHRYQSAREMATALEGALEQQRGSVGPVTSLCRACGASDLQGSYCGVCGTLVTSVPLPHAITRRAVPALVGRARERDWIREQRRAARRKFTVVELLGRPGVGKTALLHAVAEEFRSAGDHVVMTGAGSFSGVVTGSAYCEIIRQ